MEIQGTSLQAQGHGAEHAKNTQESMSFVIGEVNEKRVEGEVQSAWQAQLVSARDGGHLSIMSYQKSISSRTIPKKGE